MQTITIKIHNDKTLKLLEELEALNLIQIIKKSVSRNNQKLSERFAGSLNLKDEEYHAFQQYLTQSREEWKRDI